MLLGEAEREAPVRTEPHPTRTESRRARDFQMNQLPIGPRLQTRN
jgi:hypothetical protein